jgi:hypothetical protein
VEQGNGRKKRGSRDGRILLTYNKGTYSREECDKATRSSNISGSDAGKGTVTPPSPSNGLYFECLLTSPDELRLTSISLL